MQTQRLDRPADAFADEHYREWFQDNPMPMWVFDPQSFAFLDVNDSAVHHYGYTRDEFLARTILDIRPSEDVPVIVSRIRGGFPGRTQTVPARHLTKDGSLLQVEIYAQQIAWNGVDAEIIQIHDVTELKRAEEALRNLSGRLLQIQDDQKRTMARELHDAVGQTLTALLAKLAATLERGHSFDPESRKTLRECLALASEVLGDIRTFSYLLHPPMLDEEGVHAALDLYIEGYTERSGIDVEIDVPPDLGRLPQELEITLFRVVQEALTNVHRHSASRKARVGLWREAGTLVLEVRDQGRGMPAEVLNRVRRRGSTAGVGLAGMRERVAQIGGQLSIESSRLGSIIRVIFPE